MEAHKVVTMSERVDLENMLRRHNETYIIGGDSLTDIEARATEELADLADGDFKVISANPITFARTILEGTQDMDAHWFAVMAEYYTIDDEGERSKNLYKEKYLVKALNIAAAEKCVNEFFTDEGGYQLCITSAAMTNYVNVFNMDDRIAVQTKKGWKIKTFTQEKDGK